MTRPRRRSPFAGVPIWLDLRTSDLTGATAFYGGVLGWTFGRGRAGSDRTALRSGRAVAGLSAMRDEAVARDREAPNWVVGFAAPEPADVARRAEASGARILASSLERIDLLDPLGARFALLRTGDGRRMGFDVAHEPGAYDWCDLFSPDAGVTLRFYANLFGGTTEPIGAPGAESTDAFLLVGSDRVVAVFARPEAEVASWLPFFEIEDPDAAVGACTDAGGGVVDAAHDTPYGRIAVLTDRSGVRFAVNRVAGRSQA